MEIETLRLLETVRREGSLAGAARALDMDPSAVSRALARAEAALGLRLFQRSTRRLAVTEAGAAFLTRIAPVVEEYDSAREAAAQAGRAPEGRVRMSASAAFGQERVLPLLAGMQARFPGISVELDLDDRPVDLVARGLDLAVRLAPQVQGDLICTRLCATRYRVCAAPGPLAERLRAGGDPGALAAVPCLRLSLPGFRDRWLFRAAGAVEVQEVPVRGGLILSAPLALREAARAGMGPALLADWMVAEDFAAGRLVDLFPGHEVTATSFDTAAWLLYPSRAFLPARVRVVIDALCDGLRDGAGQAR